MHENIVFLGIVVDFIAVIFVLIEFRFVKPQDPRADGQRIG